MMTKIEYWERVCKDAIQRQATGNSPPFLLMHMNQAAQYDKSPLAAFHCVPTARGLYLEFGLAVTAQDPGEALEVLEQIKKMIWEGPDGMEECEYCHQGLPCCVAMKPGFGPSGWLCSRPSGHPPPHVACGGPGKHHLDSWFDGEVGDDE